MSKNILIYWGKADQECCEKGPKKRDHRVRTSGPTTEIWTGQAITSTRNVTFRLSLKNNDKPGKISKVHGLEASALKIPTLGTESYQGKINCGAFSEPDFISPESICSTNKISATKGIFEAITLFLARLVHCP